MNRYDLTGRFALITGAGGLLGPQHALALLESGADVVLTDIDRNALDALMSNDFFDGYVDKVRTLEMDVTAKESVRQAQQELQDSGSKVDILVNNAAIDPKVDDAGDMPASSRFENLDLAAWQLQLDVGLTGAFLCSQVFGSAMADGGGGVIVNIASDLSVIAPDQRLYVQAGTEDDNQPVKPVSYSVVKTGLIGLTRYLATYWADKAVRVNAISPGGIFNDQPQEFVDRLTDRIPMGRMANTDEYRAAIQFLCSDASAYMTGQNLVMDGGRSVW